MNKEWQKNIIGSLFKSPIISQSSPICASVMCNILHRLFVYDGKQFEFLAIWTKNHFLKIKELKFFFTKKEYRIIKGNSSNALQFCLYSLLSFYMREMWIGI